MPFCQTATTRIHYRDEGSGFPLLILPGGGLNATMPYTAEKGPFHSFNEFSPDYRCISMDLRNATSGQTTGPLEPERPWDSYTDDHLALMDHLGLERFFVMGFCIGGPFIWNLLRRAPHRVAAAVIVQPSGHRPELPDQFYRNNMANWGPALCERRPEISMDQVQAFLKRMYLDTGDFVFTVTRDFVRQCQTPILVLPDDIPAHPYETAMESARLAPNAQVSMYPWKDRPEHIPMAVRHIRTFLRAESK